MPYTPRRDFVGYGANMPDPKWPGGARLAVNFVLNYDELPFWLNVDGKGHLVVPYTLTTNDGKYLTGVGNADQWFALLRDSFDMLYREGRTQPRMMSVGMHCRVIGHPGRAVGLERLIDYMQKHQGVWITKRVEIARHWAKTHPFPGKGLNER